MSSSPHSEAAQPVVLQLHGITKRFGPLVANDAISLTLRRGEVVALLGENGAGKSTLMSILFGHYVADEGRIDVFGQPLPPGQPRVSLAAGIGMVHQHFALADNLTVLDNIMVGSESLFKPASAKGEARAKLVQVAQQFGLPVDPDAKVAGLTVGERQRVEILKALYRGARILILDEPTAVLTPQESEALFATLAQMVAQGLSIIFISHKLGEVLRVADRVAVLRHGKLVAEAPTQGTTQAQLAQWMVGEAVALPERRPAQRVGATVCQLDKVHTVLSKKARRAIAWSMSRSTCARAKSSPSPVSRATARSLWLMCCVACAALATAASLTKANPCPHRLWPWWRRAWPASRKTATALASLAICRSGKTPCPSACAAAGSLN